MALLTAVLISAVMLIFGKPILKHVDIRQP